MRIVCAWCEHEGKAADLGVREPCDNPTATHGLCAAHYAVLVQERPDPGLHIKEPQVYI
jgi:hypothetical protein